MANFTYKVLGQAAPPATTETDLYTVPLSAQTVVSTLTCSNRGAPTTTFRISVSVGGAATTNKDYLYYDISIRGHDCFATTIGVTLNAGDVIRVYAGNANLSFAAFGSEYL